MSYQYFQELATSWTTSLIENLVAKLVVSLNEVSLDKIVIQDNNTNQCLNLAKLDLTKLSQDEINYICNNLLLYVLQETQSKHTAQYGEPSGMIADLIKALSQVDFRTNLKAVEEKMKVVVA